jgi:hypothetical protein
MTSIELLLWTEFLLLFVLASRIYYNKLNWNVKAETGYQVSFIWTCHFLLRLDDKQVQISNLTISESWTNY